MIPSLSEMRRAVSRRLRAISRPAARTASSTSGGGLGASAGEGRLRRVLHGKLDLLGYQVAAQQLNHAQRSVDTGGHAGGAHVLAVDYHAFVRGYRAEVFQQMKGAPMRDGVHASQ